MLPAITNQMQQLAATYKKTFAETLNEGYLFEVKPSRGILGTRSLFYYQSANTLIISHVLSRRIHLINLTTGKLRWYDHHGTTVRNILVSNHEIISGSWDGTVCITDFDTLEKRLVCTDAQMGRCPDMVVSPDHRFLYSYSYDSDRNPARVSNCVRKWSLTNGNRLNLLELPGKHMTGRRCGSCVVNENQLFVVSDSGHLHIYDCQTFELKKEVDFKDQLQSACILPAFNLIAIGGDKGNIYLHDYSGKKIKHKIKAHQYDVALLMVHPEKSDRLISVSFDGFLKVWSLPDLKLIHAMGDEYYRLWTATAMNELYLKGGEDRDILIYAIVEDGGPKLMGSLTIFEESYAFLSADSNAFYATDLSTMQIRKKENNELVHDQHTNYLLRSSSNFENFGKLFQTQKKVSEVINNNSLGYFQLNS